MSNNTWELKCLATITVATTVTLLYFVSRRISKLEEEIRKIGENLEKLPKSPVKSVHFQRRVTVDEVSPRRAVRATFCATSDSEYGDAEEEWFDQDTPKKPESSSKKPKKQ
ncbi:unnamed protein product [Caenorhabditis angaria]|uniref:Uncharacterized protein n=1 Tax=Caenorhabditis angaria TaxID=860376 RepID=A0A9P1N6W4_9PELO|nr:unnamed protein product [Caenorhabditis angaria]